MKTAFYSALFVFMGVAVFSACSEESLRPSSVEVINGDTQEGLSARTSGLNRHYFDNGNPVGVPGVDYGCVSPPVTCFDDIVVSGDSLTAVNDIFSNIASWTPSQLQAYVDTNSGVLSDIIGSSETSGIIGGTYNLRVRGSGLTSHRYLITRNGSSIVSVAAIEN